MLVRKATKDDTWWIVKELRKFAEFFNSDILPYSDDVYTAINVNRLMDNHLFYVAEKDGELVGFVAGQIGTHFFSPNIKTLHEIFWWVTPEKRHTRAGLMLLEAFTEWGKANVNWTIFSLPKNTLVKDKSLLKRGYKVMETNYFMEVR